MLEITGHPHHLEQLSKDQISHISFPRLTKRTLAFPIHQRACQARPNYLKCGRVCVDGPVMLVTITNYSPPHGNQIEKAEIQREKTEILSKASISYENRLAVAGTLGK